MELFNFKEEKEGIAELKRKLEYSKQRVLEEKKELAEATQAVEDAKNAQEVLQLVSQAVQQRAHEKISEVVTSCLEAVFGEDAYEFKISFEMKRGKTEAHLKFVRDGLEVDPMSATGGGVVDVAAFALRVACLVLHRPRLSQVIILDEPFRFVSEDYQPNVRIMLEKLAEDLKIQIVMVTHNEAYETGTVIYL